MNDLINFYKILIEEIFYRSNKYINEEFIKKLIKKAEKTSTNFGNSLLSGLDYSEGELHIKNLLTNYENDKTNFSAQKIAGEMNFLLDNIQKALLMLIGKNETSKILKSSLDESISNNKLVWEKINSSLNLMDFLPDFLK